MSSGVRTIRTGVRSTHRSTRSPIETHHALDFNRFASDAVGEFQAEQVAIIRELSPGRWITHNYMMHFNEFDHYANCEVLDFASWDSYPLGQIERSTMPESEKVRWARTGHPDWISWNHDVYRGLKGRRDFWVMEQGAGQVNWAPSNCIQADGAVALWTAQAYAHGASCVSYFRWRAATIAQELMHSGILRHDETLDRGGQEISRMEMAGRANGIIPARIALLHDYESQWIYDIQPHSANASYVNQTMLFYTALRSLGLDVDIRHPDTDLSGYAVIVSPAIQLMSTERAAHLASYARESQLVFGPRSAYRTETGRVHEDGQPGPLRGLVGQRLLNFDGMRPGLTVHAGGHLVETLAQSYEPTGAEVIATYDDGPLAGQAAVTRNGPACRLAPGAPRCSPNSSRHLRRSRRRHHAPSRRRPSLPAWRQRSLDELHTVRRHLAGRIDHGASVIPIPGIA